MRVTNLRCCQITLNYHPKGVMDIRSVERTVRLLEELAAHRDGLRLVDLCEITGLNASTVLRFMRALERMGYAVRNSGDGRYSLGPRAGRLGPSASLLVLQRLSKPYMEELQVACGEDVNLAILDAGAVLCIETQKASNILGVNFASGLRMPVHASSIGKAILAFLPQDKQRALLSQIELQRFTPATIVSMAKLWSELESTRRRGYSTDKEEHTPGVVCIGAPVFDMECNTIAALSITAPVQRVSCDELESRYSGLLLATAEKISAALGCNRKFANRMV